MTLLPPPLPLQVESQQQPGLEYDAEAEEELWAASRLARGGPSEGAIRFTQLHDLWSSYRQ